jgi:hypothetical protein
VTSEQITEADVDGFRRKLDEWSEDLTAGERGVLAMVLHRAFPDDEVAGFAVISPRDPASGLPTGKRMHKPFMATAGMDGSFGILIGLDLPDVAHPELPPT